MRELIERLKQYPRVSLYDEAATALEAAEQQLESARNRIAEETARAEGAEQMAIYWELAYHKSQDRIADLERLLDTMANDHDYTCALLADEQKRYMESGAEISKTIAELERRLAEVSSVKPG
jgi:hypothetical protein